MPLDPEPEGHEFGYYVLNSLPDMNTLCRQEVAINMLDNAILAYDNNPDTRISDKEIKEQQTKDDFCKHILTG